MNARECAVKILLDAEQNKSFLSLALKDKLNALTEKKEKSLATELVYGSVRYKKLLDYVRDLFLDIKLSKVQPLCIEIIRISIYQILFCEKIPDSAACSEAVKIAEKLLNKGAAGFVNALLRKVCKNKDNVPYPEDEIKKLGIKESFPKTILDIWISDYGFQKATEIAINSNVPKKANYRINRLKAPKDFEIPEDIGSPQNEKLFSDGFVTVQDKGSCLAVETLDPRHNEKILDLCAAPGGKSCYISERMENTGEVTACDVYEHRLELIRKTADRLGAKNIKTVINDGTVYNPKWEGVFDKVLADVPCSGLGVISGKPDIKWRKQDFDKLCDLQYNILVNAMRYVKIGGVLVYSTCTVHKAENDDIIKKALESNKNFSLCGEPVQLFPCALNDGFFVCRLKRCE